MVKSRLEVIHSWMVLHIRGAWFEETCDVGKNAHHGNRIGPHDEKIASRHYQRHIQQKLAVGKMELHLEEEVEAASPRPPR